MMNNQIVLTIDMEDWFHSLDPFPENWNSYERRIEYGTKKILELLAEKKSYATFFILGDVAKHHSDLIKEIYKLGHEIGSHGSNHQFIYKQSKVEFRADLRNSISYLSDLIGDKIVSYRAPYFSITKKSIWALDILSEEGIKIDSSIFPVINHRYGIPDSPRVPYKMSSGLWEWPITTYKTFFGNVPFAGGFYFRFFPSSFMNRIITSLQRKREPILFYFHPWEFDADQPYLNNISWFLKFRHYLGLNKNMSKLFLLLNDISSITLRQSIDALYH